MELVSRNEIYATEVKTVEQRYPKAGDRNATVQLGIVVLSEDPQACWVDLGEETDIYLANVKWISNTQLSYLWQSRDQKELELRALNIDVASMTTSSHTTVMREHCPAAWVNLPRGADLVFLESNNTFLCTSERSG